MAEVQQKDSGGDKGGKVRAKKGSTKIDMTPMVDLAFLLLTFFIMTTTFNKPQTMEIVMPEKPKPGDIPPKAPSERVLSVILDEKDKVYYYMGIEDPKVQLTDYSPEGLRKLLVDKNNELMARYGRDKGLIVLIKPTDKSRYKNVVDILDEMAITEMKTYAIVPVDPKELDLIKGI